MNANHEAEVLRIHDRFLIELVERYQLCPWAKAARQRGRMQRRVVQDVDPPEEKIGRLVQELTSKSGVEVAFVIFPFDPRPRKSFEAFGEAVRKRLATAGVPTAVAAFHPEAQPNAATAASLLPFLRRAPDPTLQLLPLSVLELIDDRGPPERRFVSPAVWSQAASQPEVSVRMTVADANLDTVRRVGVAQLDRVFQDIRRDRTASYGEEPA